MRAYKIILLIILALLIGLMIFSMINTYEYMKQNSEVIYIVIIIAIGLIAAILAFIYHIKSFRYYRESKRKEELGKLPMILWVGSIVTGVYYLLFGTFGILGLIGSNLQYDSTMILSLIIIALFGAFSLVETSILKKRIKILHEENTLHNEIDEIGN
jgi:hypothetical protein